MARYSELRQGMPVGVLLVAIAGILSACDARKPWGDSLAATATDSRQTDDFAPVRADWDAFVARLPEDATAAAAALDQYRKAHGLPFPFVVKDSATAVAHGLHGATEEMGGEFLATAFVQRMPDSLSVLRTTPVYEFDAQGKVLHEWAIPADADYWVVVEGVVGDELITDYRDIKSAVHLYIRPDRTYRISATPPLEDERSQWIDVGDSTFLYVGGGATNERIRHTASFANAEGVARMIGKEPPKGIDVGHWIPSADSGWYVRVDTLPGLPVRAHAMTFNERGVHAGARCPGDKRFEGMICTLFPATAGKRMLAYPAPIT